MMFADSREENIRIRDTKIAYLGDLVIGNLCNLRQAVKIHRDRFCVRFIKDSR